jgi:hypothetical protein
MVQDRYFYDPKTQPIRSIVTWTIWTDVTAASIRPCLAARIPLVASSVDGQTMRAIRVLRTAWGITVAFGNGRAGLWAAPNRLVEEPAFPPASSPARAAKRLRICCPSPPIHRRTRRSSTKCSQDFRPKLRSSREGCFGQCADSCAASPSQGICADLTRAP